MCLTSSLVIQQCYGGHSSRLDPYHPSGPSSNATFLERTSWTVPYQAGPPYPVNLYNVTMLISFTALMESVLIQFICLGDCIISLSPQRRVPCEGHRLAGMSARCCENVGALWGWCSVCKAGGPCLHATVQPTSPVPVQGPTDLS